MSFNTIVTCTTCYCDFGHSTHACKIEKRYTVKTFGLLQPYFGHLSCMPVVCVTHYKLQKDASYLNQSLSVVEKPLLNEDLTESFIHCSISIISFSEDLFGYTPGISTTTMQPGTPPGADV